MKILVCISKAPDTTSKIAFKDNDTRFAEEGVQWIINPYDEWYALVRALELKEKLGGTVTTISVGGADYDPIIRKAFAIGADDGIRIDAQPLDAFFVAKQVADFAKAQNYDIVFLGRETIDYNGSQVGGMVAEFLDLPFVSMATKLELNGNVATCERDIQGGTEVLEVKLPFVLSAAKGMAEQRIPNMRGIMAARTKSLKVIPATETPKHTAIISFTMPPPKAACKMIPAESPEQLIELLHSEAKVI